MRKASMNKSRDNKQSQPITKQKEMLKRVLLEGNIVSEFDLQRQSQRTIKPRAIQPYTNSWQTQNTTTMESNNISSQKSPERQQRIRMESSRQSHNQSMQQDSLLQESILNNNYQGPIRNPPQITNSYNTNNQSFQRLKTFKSKKQHLKANQSFDHAYQNQKKSKHQYGIDSKGSFSLNQSSLVQESQEQLMKKRSKISTVALKSRKFNQSKVQFSDQIRYQRSVSTAANPQLYQSFEISHDQNIKQQKNLHNNQAKSISNMTKLENESVLYQNVYGINNSENLLDRLQSQQQGKSQIKDKIYQQDSTEMIRNTNLEIKRTFLSLNRVIQNRSEYLHLSESRPLDFEQIPDYPVFIRVSLKGNRLPPCTINVKTQTSQDQISSSLEFYLSTFNSSPNYKNHQVKYKNVVKILFGGSQQGIQEVFKADNLYIGVYSDYFCKVSLTCSFKEDENLKYIQKKTKINKKNPDQDKMAQLQQDMFNNQQKNAIESENTSIAGDLANNNLDTSNNVLSQDHPFHYLLTLQGTSRKDHTLDISRKVQLLFGDPLKQQEFTRYLQEIKERIKREKYTMKEDQENPNRLITRNLELAQFYQTYERERRLLLSQYHQTKIKNALQRKSFYENQKRRKSLELANRWVNLRKERHLHQIQLEKLSIESKRHLMWQSLMASHSFLQIIFDRFNVNRKHHCEMLRKKWLVRSIQRIFKKKSLKFAPSRILRQVNTIRECLSIEVMFCKDKYINQAQTIMHSFLKAYTKKASIKIIFIQYYEKILSIQEKFTRVIQLNKARVILLKRYWEECQQKIVLSIVKKKKDKKDTNKLQKLQNISHEIREAVIQRYFNKCKMKHAAAFFEWRKKRQQVKVKRSIETILNLRRKDTFIDQSLKQKLESYGVDGLVQIEEKRLKHENLTHIDTLVEIEQREVIATNYQLSYREAAKALDSRRVIQPLKLQKMVKKVELLSKLKQNTSQKKPESNSQQDNTFLTNITEQNDDNQNKRNVLQLPIKIYSLRDQESAKLFRDIRNPNLVIDEEFWNPPQFRYWPSFKLMKKIIMIGVSTKEVGDLIF